MAVMPGNKQPASFNPVNKQEKVNPLDNIHSSFVKV